jgi:RNA polymerase sigma-70 factor (ECF subfamily)
VKRLIRQYGDSFEQRQDLEGEIYFRFCSLLDEFDPARGIPLRAYLVRKLITSAYTYARSQWRRQRHEVSLEFRMESGVEGGEAARPVDPTSEWTSGLMKKELLEVIQEAIGKLPHRQRQVVIWRYYESKPFNEIAEMLGVCEATARSLLRHGINNVRRKIKRTDLWPDL